MNIKLIRKMLKYNSEKNDNWCFKSWHKCENYMWFFNGYMMVAIPKWEEAKVLRFFPNESKQHIPIKNFIPKNWTEWDSIKEYDFNEEYIKIVNNVWDNNFDITVKYNKYHMVFIYNDEVIAYILGRR